MLEFRVNAAVLLAVPAASAQSCVAAFHQLQ